MSSLAKMAASVSLLLGCYLAFAIEASCPTPNVLPHLPLAFLAWAVWALPASAAVIVAAFLGFGCDLIQSGPLGPTVIAATAVSFTGGWLRRRWNLESTLAFLIFSGVVGAAIMTGQAWGADALEGRASDFRHLGLLTASRAISTAVVAIFPMIIGHAIDRMRRIATAL